MTAAKEKVVVYRDQAGEWRWRRLAANGELVSESGESYLHKSYAVGIAGTLNPSVEVEVEDG